MAYVSRFGTVRGDTHRRSNDGLIPRDPTAYDIVMVYHGKVHGGVVVLDHGEQLPEGARVAVIPEVETPTNSNGSPEMTSEEHARLLSIIDRIAALPIEGDTDPFSGADHDRVLYGMP
jgi:hypothetical protein